MQNLNQLLLESPDVVDKPNATALPPASSSVHAKGGCEPRLILAVALPKFVYTCVWHRRASRPPPTQSPPTRNIAHPYQPGLAVRFDDVSFNYPEQRPEAGLKHVGFEIPPGTTTALVGSTGACVFVCVVAAIVVGTHTHTQHMTPYPPPPYPPIQPIDPMN